MVEFYAEILMLVNDCTLASGCTLTSDSYLTISLEVKGSILLNS